MYKEIYERAVQEIGLTYSDTYKSFVLYKGFKIEKNKDQYTLLDVRTSDFYSKLSQVTTDKIAEVGLKSFAMIEVAHRTKQRVEDLKRRKIALYKEADYYRENLKVDPVNQKRLGVALRDIDEVNADLSYYELKLKEYSQILAHN